MAEHTPTQGPWHVRQWSSDMDTKEASGSIYAMPRTGHAYAVAMCPRYQTEEQWNADAAFIVKACNSHEALTGALLTAIMWLQQVHDDVQFPFDGDFVPPDDRLIARLQKVLDSAAHSGADRGGMS